LSSVLFSGGEEKKTSLAVQIRLMAPLFLLDVQNIIKSHFHDIAACVSLQYIVEVWRSPVKNFFFFFFCCSIS